MLIFAESENGCYIDLIFAILDFDFSKSEIRIKTKQFSEEENG